MHLLDDLARLPGPFPLACTDRAFDAETLTRLQALFEAPQAWARHQDHFYRCFIAEVDGQLPEAWLQALRRRVAEVLSLDLAGPVRVTAQRMEAHDGSERHTDQPQAGYEAARLIVQLDHGVGGHFRAFDGDRTWLDRPPHQNGAVAFELCPASHHDVTACTGTRRTVVFHFWHAANPLDAREALDALLGACSFRDLPRALDPVMAEAEARYPDARTFLAGSVAWLLHRWGHPVDAVVDGYRRVVQDRPLAPAEALARWLVHLHVDGFDRQAWERLPRSGWATAGGPDLSRWLARGPRCPGCDAVRLAGCRWCEPPPPPLSFGGGVRGRR